jgi:hypothetical protein
MESMENLKTSLSSLQKANSICRWAHIADVFDETVPKQ